MKPLVSTFALALAIYASAAAAQSPVPRTSSDPTASDTKSQDEIRRIVEGREFRVAARSRNIARMNKLLKGTGAVAATPVAIFFCRPPEVAHFPGGVGHCGARKVEPFMYAD